MAANYRPDLMGHVELTPDGEFEAGTIASFTLVYTCGKFGIDDLGMVLIAFRSANDQTALQTHDPAGLGFVTAEASNGATLDIRYDPRGYVRPWYKALIIRAKQFLREGDRITVRIGDRRQGSEGLRLQTFCEPRFEFRILVDPIATGGFMQMPSSPTIALVPGPPAHWKAVLPTQRRPGETFRMGLKAEDKWGNPTDRAGTRLKLCPTKPISGLPDIVEFKPGAFTRELDGLSVSEPGDLHVNLIDLEGDTVVAASNPLRITADGALSRYWSDLHGQSEETIGTNSARDYFLFGRDRAFLDICAHQGNDFQITDEFWKDLNALTAEFNEAGRFVTLPGYEWSGNTGVGGDHNVWYRGEGRPIYRSSRALVDDLTQDNPDCHTAVDLFNALRREDAIVTAHCGGRYADVKYAHDSRTEPSVEIHSCWGTFEWIVRDALEAGYRVGIVAASDGHKGRPGSSYPGASKFGAFGGYTCHLMGELTRDALFESFRRRHHYATTGARIWLDVSAEFSRPATIFHTNPDSRQSDHEATPELSHEPTHETAPRAMMGDIVAVDDDVFDFTVDILGTAPIERVEIRDGLDLLEVVRPYGPEHLGARIRVIWEGAETRGRGRNAVWDGSAVFSGNRIRDFRGINFWNAERPPRLEGDDRIVWSSFTTGSFSGIDVWLEHDKEGVLKVETPSLTFELPLCDIGYDDKIFEAGGLEKRMRIFRLPDENPHRSMTVNRRMNVRADGDTRPYVCVTQEDGHRAWSSPLYIFRKDRKNVSR